MIERHEVAGVAPLDRQFGVWPVKTIPDAVAPILSGEGGLYTLLDGARMPGIEALLAAHPLRAACLFRGDAFSHAAPWLVELAPESALTRALFTADEGPAGPTALWAAQAAVLIRSGAGFDALHTRARKCTRLRAPDGAWLFLRFWDPAPCAALMDHLMESGAGGPFPPGTDLLLPNVDGKTWHYRLGPDAPAEVTITLTEPLIRALASAAERRQLAQIVGEALALWPTESPVPNRERRAMLMVEVLTLRSTGWPVMALAKPLAVAARFETRFAAMPDELRALLDDAALSHRARGRLMEKHAPRVFAEVSEVGGPVVEKDPWVM
ncbi:MAG: DUF4123 domain-containing protein [Pseudomonadota bacterium]